MRGTSKMALVPGGGNALETCLAGAYEHLHRQDVRPDWIVGASVSALTGAILAGSTSEQRLEKLGQFWAEATQHTHAPVSRNETLRQTCNGMYSVLTPLFCRPNIIQRSPDPALVTPLRQGRDRKRLV
jgi:NTE family protein